MSHSSLTHRWSPLKPDDTISIVAPGSSVPEDQIKEIVHFLVRAGYSVHCPQDLVAPELFVSNTDENRARHLITALHDAKSTAVWCLRNGYGSNRVMPFLTKISQPKRVKLFMGASDATPIHIFINTQWGWPSLWCPALDKLTHKIFPQAIRNEIGMILNGKISELTFSGLRPLNSTAQFSNEYHGSLIGGSLTSICSSMATPWQLNPTGCILLLEEMGLRATRIDQHLEHLAQVGVFERVVAVVFGSFAKCTEPDGSTHWPSVLERFSKKFKKPFVFGMPSSHTGADRPIPLGTQATLYTGAINKLVCATNINASNQGPNSSILKVS